MRMSLSSRLSEDEKAGRSEIEAALDRVEHRMKSNKLGQDVAVILISTHGGIIDENFHIIPYGFDASLEVNKMADSALSVSKFAEKGSETCYSR